MSPEQIRPPEQNSLSTALERHLAIPVLVSAVLSVPAVFLALWGQGIWSEIGARVNWLAGLVLWAEWILLIVLAEDKLGWLRTHRWSTFVAVLTVPAVVFALGPAQLLRLTKVAGTLRLVRVTRIIEAGGVLRRRMGLRGLWGKVALIVTLALSAVFIATVLLDPDSPARRFLADLPGLFEPWKLLLAAVLIAIAGALILAIGRRGARNTKDPGTQSSDGSGALDDDSTQSP
ncbi:metal-sensitive transcriptional repressor family protein [Nocardiopsis sp. JB363]|uniref:metal-sensitive transcriptional repressor family protein n=1 Tax=Nocardiopsis sp. JB363 TaxID=1434837 RepID=UPI00097B1B0D|nr:metal-sensitive transcriptional repressor family protein [Nocardiopsis sp. JB363]SIO85696.1 COG0477: Permeases of the major facilitator superfamily [Nocardiopsis sp. JB363]